MGNEDKRHRRRVSRRGFISGSLAALAGMGFSAPRTFESEAPEEKTHLKVKEYRTLGRTGFQVSDIGFGSGELTDPALLDAILDVGINYIDTAEGYGRGSVERTIGGAIKNRNRRSIFITTKLGLRRYQPKERYIERARKCLERLQTEYIDCLMIHMPSTTEQLKTQEFHAAVRQLKAEGRVKFCGLSNHGSQWREVPETMERVHLAAAEDGRFDVALLVYNFIQREMGENILRAYRKKNVGTAIMKTNPVLNYMETKERADRMQEAGGEISDRLKTLISRLKARADKAEVFKKKYNLKDFSEIREAAIKFVLRNPNVNTVCLTIKNHSDLEAYMALSGSRLGTLEQQKLSVYEDTFGDFYCRHSCGECESQCPHGVPVNTIMRYNHYFEAQGREKTAMVRYDRLRKNKADNCLRCEGYCEKACPYGIPIQGLLLLAHRTLTLA